MPNEWTLCTFSEFINEFQVLAAAVWKGNNICRRSNLERDGARAQNFSEGRWSTIDDSIGNSISCDPVLMGPGNSRWYIF